MEKNITINIDKLIENFNVVGEKLDSELLKKQVTAILVECVKEVEFKKEKSFIHVPNPVVIYEENILEKINSALSIIDSSGIEKSVLFVSINVNELLSAKKLVNFAYYIIDETLLDNEFYFKNVLTDNIQVVYTLNPFFGVDA